MKKLGQSSIEYLLLIAGVVLVAALVLGMLSLFGGRGSTKAETSFNSTLDLLDTGGGAYPNGLLPPNGGTSGVKAGDNYCDNANGENCSNSPADCACQAGYTCNSSTKQCETTPAYTITLSQTAGGTISTADSTTGITAGSSVNITATQDNGFELISWNSSNPTNCSVPSGNTTPIAVIVNGDCTISATFTATISQVTLTVNAGTGGSIVTPTASAQYPQNYSTPITITAQANSNYQFANWTKGSSDDCIMANSNEISTTVSIKTTNCTLTANFSSTLDPNLVAYYKFDETSGTTAADSSDNGYSATLANFNCTTSPDCGTSGWTNSGAIGKAIRSSTSDGGISRNIVTNATTNITISGWVYWDGTSYASTLIYLGNGGSNGYGLRIGNNTCGSGNKLTVLLGGVNCDAINSNYTLPINQWNFVTLTRDSTTWKLYVNGVYTGYSGTSNPNTPTGSLSIYPVYGKIDEVKIYNRTLTATEIQNEYNTIAPKIGLIAYYKFDEASGTSAADSTINSNNGTLQGTAIFSTGKIGNALNLPGNSTSYVTVPDSTSFNESNGYTITGWYYLNSLVGWQQLAFKGQTPQTCGSNSYYCVEMQLQMRGSDPGINKWYSYPFNDKIVSANPSDAECIFDNYTVLTNGWHHVAVVWNPAASPTTSKWYINGVLTKTCTPSTGSYSFGDTTGALNIGSGSFNGKIDELKIFNRPLSDAEISAEAARTT